MSGGSNTGTTNTNPPTGTQTNPPTMALPRMRYDAEPKEFRGDTDLDYARRFITNCPLHFRLNADHYQTDRDKVGYALGKMNEGPAGRWASDFIEEAEKPGGTYGTWENFKTLFKSKFITNNEVAEAVQELSTMKQGDRTADDFNNSFQSAVTRSGITEDHVLKGFYENALNQGLLVKVYAKGEPPATIQDYYKAASNHDNLYRRLKTLKGATNKDKPLSQRFNRFKNKNSYTGTTNNTGTSSPNPPKLTPEERARCIAQKLCFKCRQPGHTTVTCTRYPNITGSQNIRATGTTAFQQYFTPQGVPYYMPINAAPALPPQQINAVTPTPFNPAQSMGQTPAEQAAHVRALIAGMTDEQQQLFYTELDKTPEGF